MPSSDLLPRPATEADFEPMLALNNAHAVELTHAEPERFRAVLGYASHVRVCGPVAAFIIGMDHASAYDGLMFAYFCERFARFAYVDRVCVDTAYRGQGLARALYEEFFDAARAQDLRRVCAEVNVEPPNDASNAFHDGLGFQEIGRIHIPKSGKTLRYVVRELD